MSQNQPFNPRLVIGLIVAGILAFGAMVLLLAFGSQMGGGRDGRAHALSPSAVGYKGLVELVGAFRQTHLVDDVDALTYDHLAVIALEPQSQPAQVRSILDRRGGRPTLIILPKWSTIPLPMRRGWVQGVTAGQGALVAAAIGENVSVRAIGGAQLASHADGVDILEGLRLRIPPSPQTIEGANLRVLVPLGGSGPAPAPAAPESGAGGKSAAGGKEGRAAAGGPALVAQIGDEPHYVLADPDLLNNHGLRTLENARAAMALIDTLNTAEPDTVDFDLTVNGLGQSQSQSMLRLAFEPPFLAMTLALIVAALLAGLYGAFRFGPVRRPERAIAFGKAALVENSAGLIRLARREASLGGAYADVVRHEVARSVHAPPGLGPEAIDRYLDRLSPRDGPSFSQLAADLAMARDRHALMAAVRALVRWKRGVVK